MSLIGPRAHLTTNYKGYENLDDIHKRRIDVRPGITGYNQAYFRNSVTSEEKMKNDVYYVDHLSFWMDVKVFFKTIISVLKSENVYVKQEEKAVAEVNAAVAAEQTEKTEETVGADN
jgi:lipopolysaccharide/colanic/teichoic acid biosynthesis glycosyltransferase